MSKEVLDDLAAFLIEIASQLNGEAETGNDSDFFRLRFTNFSCEELVCPLFLRKKSGREV